MMNFVGKLVTAFAFLGLASGVQATIIGVDIEAGQGSPANWTSYTIDDVDSPVSNLVAEDGSISSVSFQLDGVTNTQNYAPSDGSVIPSHFNDLTTVCCDILYGGPNPTMATWSGLEPLAIYNYWIFVSSTAVDTMTVTGDDVDSFGSPSIGASTQAINGLLGDSSLTFASYARQITASDTGTVVIGIQSSGTPTPSGYAIELASDGPPVDIATEPVPSMSVYGLALTILILLLVTSRRFRAVKH